MRPLLFVAALSLSFGSQVCLASQTGMWWWHQNGDSVVLDGVTVSLSGTGIQSVDGAVQDPPGSGDATLTFTFSPPIESFQMVVRSVGPTESIHFQSPFPTSVEDASLVAEGTPIQSVRGFFLNDDNGGFVTWDGPGLTSVTFTMAHADGAIRITQMGQSFGSHHLGNAIQIGATPTPVGALLSLAISDAGGAPGVRGFVLQRRAIYPCEPGEWQTVQCITPRVPGTVSHWTIADPNVHLHTQYAYRVAGWSFTPCVPDLNQDTFLGTFDPTGWGFEILSFLATGPEPVPIAHGRIVAVPAEGPSFVRVEQCSDSCNSYTYGFAAADVLQYLGTETEVAVYGAISWSGNYYGWLSSYTAAQPQRCTVAVRSTTWSQVKRLYQDPAAAGR